MKIAFLEINVNTDWVYSLPPVYLRAYVSKSDIYPELEFVTLPFYTFNDVSAIETKIIASKPDVLAVSCYVWNIKAVLQVISQVKKELPEISIILGGPEFNLENIDSFNINKDIDFIILGEGERAFKGVIEYCFDNSYINPGDIKGLVYRDESGDFVINEAGEIIESLDEIPSLFVNDFIDLENVKNIVMETQRGCVQKCAYCFDHKNIKAVRFYDLDRVFKELDVILAANPKKLYIVDSAFNSNKKRAKAILSYILENKGDNEGFSIWAEVIPELLDEELIVLLKELCPEIIGIGVQSLDPEAIVTMGRVRNEEKLFENMELSLSHGLAIMPQIIYGLPDDNVNKFFSTFSRLYIMPFKFVIISHLLILPGTRFRREVEKHGIVYNKEPQYELIESKDFSRKDINFLSIFSTVVFFTDPMKYLICEICKLTGKEPHLIFKEFVDHHFQIRSDNSINDFEKHFKNFKKLKIIGAFCRYLRKEMVAIPDKNVKSDLQKKLSREKWSIQFELLKTGIKSVYDKFQNSN